MTFAELGKAGPAALVGRLPRIITDLVGYGLVSVVALACDYGLLVGLTAVGMHYLVAASIGFTVGIAVAYGLSAHLVFADRRAGSRVAEAAGFIAIGLAGLALTQLCLYLLVARAHMPVALAKLPTAGGVFLFNFLSRRSLVFVGR